MHGIAADRSKIKKNVSQLGTSCFSLVHTKMSWRSLLTSQYLR